MQMLENGTFLMNYLFIISICGFIILFILSIMAFSNVENFKIKPGEKIRAGIILIMGSFV